ncbi:uncharacterized protein LOC123206943 [Mangifera indica]|uniref:uncharacterized protein LOC123206943 n=1 Tax=Mangifera indica TaxID=29780 RepID=UPI001CF94B2C|nr:uncharacterized protein LOC123206943 [Mangifera indica]
MSESDSLNDAAYWSPYKFEDVLVVKKGYVKSDDEMKKSSDLSFPSEFPYEFDSLDSALCSPVESENGWTETETTSDEEDFLTGLTRRLTQSSTQKFAANGFTKDKPESWVMAGSPESSLSGIGSWSVSSGGSPNGSSSLVSSPPTTPFGDENNTWDLISAAAGQVARLKMSNEDFKCNYNNRGRGLIAPPKATTSPLQVIENPNFGLYSSQYVNFTPLQTNQYQMLSPQNGGLNGVNVIRGRQQQVRLTQPQPQLIQSKARSVVYENGRCGRPIGLCQAAWPPLQVQQRQQHSASGMKAVFLGGSGGVKRECAGTGVFLPRRFGSNPLDSPKKPSSTVLVPAKVVQALNQSFENMNGNNTHAQHRFNTAFGPQYDALMARRTLLLSLKKQRSLRPEAAPPLNHEIHLPQEWTY